MTGGNLAVLRVGDRVRFDGAVQTIVGLSGTLVRLADEHGQSSVIRLPHLLTDPTFERIGQREPRPLLPAGLLNGLPEQTVEAAQWWERHVVEVLTGLPSDAPSGTQPRPEFDPATRTLAQREQAKAKELAGLAIRGLVRGPSSANACATRRRASPGWSTGGIRRSGRCRAGPTRGCWRHWVRRSRRRPSSRRGTAGYFYWRVQQLLAAEHGAGVVPMPSRATFYRLFDQLSQGRHTTGSARTRRSLANRPDGPFRELAACRPGELVQIDSTVGAGSATIGTVAGSPCSGSTCTASPSPSASWPGITRARSWPVGVSR
jgi:hypothetical protein